MQTLDLLTNKAFDRHLFKARLLYQKRYQRLSKAISMQLGDLCQFKAIDGGMFIWLFLPDCNVHQVVKSALQEDVAVVPGDVSYAKTDRVRPALRLNFSNADEVQLSIAVTRLAKVLRANC